jgi:creatinine amidohydrolase
MRARALPLVLCLVLALGGAAYGAPASVYIEDLTWTELNDALHAGDTTVIIPIGGTEQNGPHMAIGKHNVRVKLLAGMIAKRLGNAVVAPVLSYVPEGGFNPPTGHMRFPGTITAPKGAFDAILADAARSFKLHGFRDIVFLGDHGSYQKDLPEIASRLNREWAGSPARAHAPPEYYDASEHGFAKLLESKGYSAMEVGTHAGLADTSLMMALDPGLVRADRLKPGPGDEGDPTHASAELGKLGVDLIVGKTVAAIKQEIARR